MRKVTLSIITILILAFVLGGSLLAQAPAAVTDAATAIETTQAVLNGTVNANGDTATVWFEYGTDVGYGFTFPASPSPVTGAADTPVTAIIYELLPGTTYHYRVAAQNTSGTTYGADMTFTTLNPPAAVTGAATNIGVDTATLNGIITGYGLETTVTFEWGTDTTYGDSVPADQSPITSAYPRPVTTVLTGLATDTTYHFRVVAENADGIAYGQDMTFTLGTVGTTPLATTEAATGITSGEAVLNGTVNAGDSATVVTFEYGPDTNYGSVTLAPQSPVTGTADTPVTATLTDLLPDTTYHYRVSATNANGTDTGADLTFTTLPLAPTAVTGAAAPIGTTTATLNGTVNPNNGDTAVVFEYGLDTGYGTTVTATQSPIGGTADVAVDRAITGLTTGTLYHYRVVAENITGTTYGADRTFVTGTAAPTATTLAASSIGANAATLHGSVTANNADTTVVFEYGPTTDYGRILDAVPALVTGTTPVAVSLTTPAELIPGTMYHFRVVATNASGTTYGADLTFSTLSAPAVTTTEANPVTTTTATLTGLVTAFGLDTSVTFEYGLTAAYGTTVTADQSPVTGTTPISVSANLSGLTPNTIYHFRVVGTNSEGTTYGQDLTFLTSLSAPSAVTTSASPQFNGATLYGVVNAHNSAATITFEYGTSTSYGNSVTADQSPVSGSIDTEVSATISGLAFNQTYHFRVVATNAYGTTFGNDLTFTTSLNPSATTQPATDVGGSHATLHGLGNANNGVWSVRFDYGPTTAYGSSVTATPDTISGATDTPVSALVTNLLPETTYHYRLSVYSGGINYYGADMTFTTHSAPTAVTNPASAISATGATFNGTVNPMNLSTVVSFEFGEDTSYGRLVAADQNPLTGNTDTPVSTTITDLVPNSTYHYRVVAITADSTIYGADTSFDTPGSPPAVTTQAASGVTSSAATLNGQVDPLNDTTTVTFEYGLTTAYGTTVAAEQSPLSGVDAQPVTVSITGLSSGTVYHFRVAAQNAIGTTYGDDMTFTAGQILAVATTLPATDTTPDSANLHGTINAAGGTATVYFEIGIDTGYGRIIAAIPGTVTGTGDTPVTAAATSLDPDTWYHYRVVAETTSGTTYGEDMTFRSVHQPVISGTITDGTSPLEGVTVTFSHNGHTETTDAAGHYSYTLDFADYGVTTTITPSHPGYHGWTPPSRTLTTVTADAPGQDFTGIINTYTLSGTVTDGVNPIAGVTLTFSHDGHTVLTGVDGTWSTTVDYGTTTTVTPSHPGYHGWVPAQRTLTFVAADIPGLDFAGTINTYTLSGTVTDGAAPIAGVTITFSHDGHTETTAANGTYAYVVPYGTTTTITPSHPGYHGWTPPSRTLTAVAANAPGQDFTGTINTYTVSGTITDGTTPIAGASVTFSYDGHTAVTGNDGTWSTTVPYGTSTTLTPSHPGYHGWAPATRSLNNVTAAAPGQDFTGTINRYTLSGRVSNSDGPIEGVTITFSHDGHTETTAADGTYSYEVDYGTTTTITPSHPDYHGWRPSNRTVDHVGSDLTNLNFSALLDHFTVSGTVMDDRQPVPGAIVTFSHDGHTETTADDGTYAYAVPIHTTTTVTVFHPQVGHWDPAAIDLDDVTADVPDQDFHREYRAYAAHVAVSDMWHTWLRLVNPSADASPVTVHIFDAAGTPRRVETFDELAGHGTREVDFDSLIGLGKANNDDLWAYVAGHTPLRGTLFFGTRDEQTQVGMRLFRRGSTRFRFPFVYQGDDWYTGISLLNPSPETIAVTLEAVTDTGAVLGTLDVELPPGGKFARVLGDLFDGVDPATIRAVTGTADQPVLAFELFSSGAGLGPGLAGLPPVDLDAGCATTSGDRPPLPAVDPNGAVQPPHGVRGWGISDSQVFLRWDTAAGGPAVDHYVIYRRDSIFPQPVGTTTDTCVIVADLDPATVYPFTVVAVDAAGGQSDESTLVRIPTLATGEIDGTNRVFFNELPDPAVFSTGLTLTNLGAETAPVRLVLYSVDGLPLDEWDWEVAPGEQITREVATLFTDGMPADSGYFQAMADAPLTGFSLAYTRPDTGQPFAFDGLAGEDLGAHSLCLPAAAGGEGWTSTLQLTNLSGVTAGVTVTAYNPDGLVQGTFTAELDPHGRLDMPLEEMFTLREGEIHWLTVTGSSDVTASLFSLSPNTNRLVIISGQPLD